MSERYLQMTIAELLAAAEESDEHIAACREECDELKAAVRRLQSEKDCWQAACSRRDLDIAELEKNVVIARNHVVSQAGELADRDERIAELEAAAGRRDLCIADLVDRSGARRERIAELEKKLASMTALCGDREQAMFSYRNKLELSERKVAELESEITCLQQAEAFAAEYESKMAKMNSGWMPKSRKMHPQEVLIEDCPRLQAAIAKPVEPFVSEEQLGLWEFQLHHVPQGGWIAFSTDRLIKEIRRLQSLVRPVAVDTYREEYEELKVRVKMLDGRNIVLVNEIRRLRDAMRITHQSIAPVVAVDTGEVE